MGTVEIQTSSAQEEIMFRSKYSQVEVPEYLTLPEFILADVEPYLDKVAFVDAVTGKGFTYRELNRDMQRFSKALRSLGLRKGRVVVVVLLNVAEYAIIARGIMAAGDIFSGANLSGHVSEIKKQVEAADAKLIVTDGSTYHKVKGLGLPVIIQGEDPVEGTINWNELLEAAERANTDAIEEKVLQTDICALPFSSGTTGMSKGVMLTHRNLVANLCSSLFSVGPELIGQVTKLGLIPFFHIYGLTGICCATIKNKGKVVVMQQYDLRLFLNALITHQVTFAPAVPPIVLVLVKNPIVEEFDLSKLKLRSVMTAAAPLAPEILNEFIKKFPQVQVQEVIPDFLFVYVCMQLASGQTRASSNRCKA